MNFMVYPVNTPCLKKNYAKLFLPELRQISTNFDNFWQKDVHCNSRVELLNIILNTILVVLLIICLMKYS